MIRCVRFAVRLALLSVECANEGVGLVMIQDLGGPRVTSATRHLLERESSLLRLPEEKLQSLYLNTVLACSCRKDDIFGGCEL